MNSDIAVEGSGSELNGSEDRNNGHPIQPLATEVESSSAEQTDQRKDQADETLSESGEDDSRNFQYRETTSSLIIGWWKEITFLVLAILLFVAIAIIFRIFNGNKQRSWKFSVNLSTIAAILSTVLRVSIVVVVEEGKET